MELHNNPKLSRPLISSHLHSAPLILPWPNPISFECTDHLHQRKEDEEHWQDLVVCVQVSNKRAAMTTLGVPDRTATETEWNSKVRSDSNGSEALYSSRPVPTE
jgi:hypothetical protein